MLPQTMFRANTVRTRLQLSFLVFVLIMALIVAIDYAFRKRERNLQRTFDLVQTVNTDIQMIQRLELTFFIDETINEAVYQTGQSEVLKRRSEVVGRIHNNLQALAQGHSSVASRIQTEVKQLQNAVQNHEQVFDKTVQLLLKRGFKDYGAEGAMRKNIHYIEETYGNQVDLALLLMIRRHEKDFIIRKQEQYTQKHAEAIERLKAQNQNQPNIVAALNRYEQIFKEVVSLEQQIGFNPQTGLRKQLNDLNGQVTEVIEKLNELIISTVEQAKWQNQVVQILMLAICIVLTLYLTYAVPRAIGKPVQRLSGDIQRVIQNQFRGTDPIARIESKDEIGLLSDNVSQMVETVRRNFKELREKNEEVEKKQSALMNSVIYAERMQKSLLQEQVAILDTNFERYFAIYQPKYEVSGDMYWLRRVEDRLLVAMLDCKGIGLAGSIITMITNSLLNQLISQHPKASPSQLLNLLHRQIHKSLPQGYVQMALCSIENIAAEDKIRRITLASAGLPVFVTKGLELLEFEGSPCVLGGGKLQDPNCAEHTLELHRDNMIFMMTDGLFRQMSADAEEARTQFKELVSANIHLYTTDQERILKETLHQLTQSQKQHDDISLLGLKLFFKSKVVQPEKALASV
ncbi:SpoIIE family protein phosphatase [Eisenibacter elegans]|uniref:SpoIIE family protein phosphatase n=1 Tax=Eisenibacter elegans TaxID=997 RepID=UPI000404CE03|nr:SpoIIE family protein phosphatase [Eisenibacter elegans]